MLEGGRAMRRIGMLPSLVSSTRCAYADLQCFLVPFMPLANSQVTARRHTFFAYGRCISIYDIRHATGGPEVDLRDITCFEQRFALQPLSHKGRGESISLKIRTLRGERTLLDAIDATQQWAHLGTPRGASSS